MDRRLDSRASPASKWVIVLPTFRIRSKLNQSQSISEIAVIRALGATDRSVTLRVSGKQQPFLGGFRTARVESWKRRKCFLGFALLSSGLPKRLTGFNRSPEREQESSLGRTHEVHVCYRRAELCGSGGRLRLLAVIHPPNNTRKILDCLGLP